MNHGVEHTSARRSWLAAPQTHKPIGAARPAGVIPVRTDVAPVRLSDRCVDLLDRMLENAEPGAVPVINANDTPFAMIGRHEFLEFFGLPFARELYGRKTLGSLAATGVIDWEPVTVNVAAGFQAIAQQLIRGNLQRRRYAFSVTAEGNYVGIANVQQLLLQSADQWCDRTDRGSTVCQ